MADFPDATIPNEPYEFREFPKLRYHPAHGALEVSDPSDQDERTPDEDGWADAPPSRE